MRKFWKPKIIFYYGQMDFIGFLVFFFVSGILCQFAILIKCDMGVFYPKSGFQFNVIQWICSATVCVYIFTLNTHTHARTAYIETKCQFRMQHFEIWGELRRVVPSMLTCSHSRNLSSVCVWRAPKFSQSCRQNQI